MLCIHTSLGRKVGELQGVVGEFLPVFLSYGEQGVVILQELGLHSRAVLKFDHLRRVPGMAEIDGNR